MIDPQLRDYARRLGADCPDVKHMLAVAGRSPEAAEIARSVFQAKLRGAKRDPHDDDPFSSVLTDAATGGSGVGLGPLADDGRELIWRHDEIPYSGLVIGAPGAGKTSAVLRVLMQLVRWYCVIVIDVRGDYECLVREVHDARFFAFGTFPVNLLHGPSP